MSNVVEMTSFRKEEKSMNDVYEMKVIRTITTEETEIVEVNKDLDLNDEKTINEIKSFCENDYYGHRNRGDETNRKVKIEFKKPNPDECYPNPQKYLTKHNKTDSLVREENQRLERVGNDSYHGYVDPSSLYIPFFSRQFCPDRTKTVLHYESNSDPRSGSPIPSSDCKFYFDIDKESVSKLWKSGDFEELDKHNIIPQEGFQNHTRWNYRGDCHPNDTQIIKEIYKRRKTVSIKHIDLYDVDVWRNEDTYELDKQGFKNKVVGISLLD